MSVLNMAVAVRCGLVINTFGHALQAHVVVELVPDDGHFLEEAGVGARMLHRGGAGHGRVVCRWGVAKVKARDRDVTKRPNFDETNMQRAKSKLTLQNTYCLTN